MANHDISNPMFEQFLRMFETSDRGHADVFNEIAKQLINNDVSLRETGGIYGVDEINTNNYALSHIGISEYKDGLPVCIKVVNASTEESTLQIDELGNIPIKDSFGNAVKCKANLPYNMRYEKVSNSFILLGEGGGGDALPEELLINKKATTDTGQIVGTMPDNGAVDITIENNDSEYIIPKGYHNGLGKVKAILTNLVASVIKTGTTVGGILGTFTSDATATAAQIMSGQIAYVKGQKVTGTATKKAATTYTPGTGNQTIPSGVITTGIQIIKGDTNLIAGNIIKGKSIFGVAGTATISSLGGYKLYRQSVSGTITQAMSFEPWVAILLGSTGSSGNRCVYFEGGAYGQTSSFGVAIHDNNEIYSWGNGTLLVFGR